MSLYDDGDFSTPQPDGAWDELRPFFEAGDINHRVIIWPHIVSRTDYAPTALDTLHPTIAGCYLVDESGFEDIGANLQRFFRTYSTIPATRLEPSGSEGFQFPGLPAAVPGATRTISAVVTNNSAFDSLTTSGFTGTVGSFILVGINYTIGALSGSYAFAAEVLTGSTATSVRIPKGYINSGRTFSSGTLWEDYQISRIPFVSVSNTVTSYEYFLPGVTPGISEYNDIKPSQIFRPFDPITGEDVQTLSAQTFPTAAQYRSTINAGGYLVIQSTVNRYRGNILVRETRQVLAQ